VTREQRRSLQIIAGLTLIHGQAPALGELAAALHISKPSAFERLHWMAKKGLYCSTGRRLTPSGLELVVAELQAAALAPGATPR
jgi:Mn-dependent DtxR family transcriptional regulator